MSDPTTVVAVTGASGLIGGHVVALLVKKGYRVHAAVRSTEDNERNAHLRALGDAVTLFCVPDIMQETGFAELCAGATFLIHMASPVVSDLSSEEFVKLATSGTLNALKAALAAGVSRVVLTASMASVCGNQRETDDNHLWSPEDFNDAPSSAYSLSKTRAEECAWEFIASDAVAGKMSLATIHPGCCFGPLLAEQRISSTMLILKAALDGTEKAAGGLEMRAFGVADVRDVARVHVAAMEKNAEPAGTKERYLATSNDQFSILELVKMAVEHKPELADTAAMAFKDPEYADYESRKPSSDNSKTCKLLGVEHLTPVVDTIRAAVHSLHEYGHLDKPVVVQEE
eukprot:TRINITY_DN4103_c0_g1_i1.p1 TRINITY_DN4103_c0_g1~~TRINITY_DN4103_c0_g1_i1.p1  ORF type:complete len:358 (-),score=100.16 TRINITY_DN4103_c0_g1_i1:43-1071(-)